jgi:hypothetical protein
VVVLLLVGPLEAADVLSLTSLGNAEYASSWTVSGRVRLRDGHYREPAAPGSATEIRVWLLERIATWTAVGTRYAAVILVTDPGGSGTFSDLVVVQNRRGRPVQAANGELGDRVRVQSLGVARRNGQTEIHVGLVAPGPDDPLCCPTRRVVRVFVLNGRSLVPRAAE